MPLRNTWLALATLWPLVSSAATNGYPLQNAGTDIGNLASLQRGARNFVNYCLGCHSAQYMRHSQVADDLALTESQLRDNLMFTGTRVYDPMKSSMPPELARQWFGNAPPDLSLIARSRGVDYVYTFLKSFYADPSAPSGVNNAVLANTVMPHVLAGLQGLQTARWETHTDRDGRESLRLVSLDAGKPGEMNAQQYEGFVRDLVNFLDYVAEPAKAQRLSLGIWVILFLLLFLTLAYFLKQEYWKDVK